MAKYKVLRPFGNVTHDQVGEEIEIPTLNRAGLMIRQHLIAKIEPAPMTGSEPKRRTSGRKKAKAQRPKTGQEVTA